MTAKDVMSKENQLKDQLTLTAASTFAGDSSLGLESIEMILNTMLSTCQKKNCKYYVV